MPSGPPVRDDRPLWDVTLSAYHLPVLAAADELGVFGFLTEASAGAEEVARRFGLGERATTAMLNVLAALGFLARRSGRYELTEVSRSYLLPGEPFYWGDMLRLLREPTIDFAALMQCLRTDRPVTEEEDRDLWAAHSIDAEKARAFTAAMHSHSMAPALAVARRGDFRGVTRLLDVGGASGCFPIAIAQRYPEVRFTVLDLPVVCELTHEYAAEAGIADRLETVALDMFRDPWPAGHDAVLLSNVFHDWDPARCRELAAKSWALLPPGGRIYVHEMLVDEGGCSPLAPSTYSVDMACYTEGRQYTGAELEALLQEVGFARTEVVHTHGYFWLVTGYKS